MEKKHYKFTAYNSRGNQIQLTLDGRDLVYECTKEQADWLQLGIIIGLETKYTYPKVRFEKID